MSVLNPTSDDLASIYAYVEAQRVNIPKFPALLAQIEAFEQWYGDLGPLDWLQDQQTLATAKQKRDEINATMGQHLDPTVVPADHADLPPGSASSPEQSHGTDTVLALLGLAGAGLLAWKLLS